MEHSAEDGVATRKLFINVTRKEQKPRWVFFDYNLYTKSEYRQGMKATCKTD